MASTIVLKPEMVGRKRQIGIWSERGEQRRWLLILSGIANLWIGGGEEHSGEPDDT
jgi:hypothetical protein